MDHGSRRTPNDRFEQASRNLLRWIVGPGLLSLHIGVYLISVVALLLWNFARTPNDVWVDGPLRNWGLVVVFHITAVAVGWSAWRLMRLGETPPIAPQRSPRRGSTATRQFGGETTALPVNRVPADQSATNAIPVDDGARDWLRGSVRLVREVVGDTSANGTTTNTPASTVSGPGITEWGALFVRRTREMMISARDHVSPAQRARQEKLNESLNGVSTPAPRDPNHTWPETTGDLSLLMSETQVMRVNGTWPTSLNGSLADQTALNGSDGAAPYADSAPSDPIRPTTESIRSVDPAANEDARWTWVESAAAAWMSRRERDELPTNLPNTPPPPSDDATTTQ